MKNIYLVGRIALIIIGLIDFIELIQTSPIEHGLGVTLPNEFIDLGEIDTSDEPPAVYVFKRLVESMMADMNGEIVSNFSYDSEGVQRQETTMIVDGKPFVMGSYTVTDPNGHSIMTVYTAGKDGYKPQTKIRYTAKANKDKLLKSLVGR